MVIHPDENSVMIGSWDIPRYGLVAFAFITLLIALYFIGFYGAFKRLLYDCLFDHTTKRFTINNLARMIAVFSFFAVFMGSHFHFQVKPHLKITTILLSELEMTIILGFIIGGELARKAGTFGTPKKEEPQENMANASRTDSETA